MQLSSISLALTRSGILRPFAGASLYLDFTSGNQALDPRVTFTRASNATRVNSSGLIELVAVNQPRFNYDPMTLAPKGLLIEEQRTNLLSQSQFASGWTNSGAAVTLTANSAIAPDGTTTAAKLTGVGGGAEYIYRAGVSFTTGTAYTMTVYAKKANSSTVVIRSFTQAGRGLFDLTLITASSEGIGSNASITSVGNGWYRCSVVFTATETGSNNVGYDTNTTSAIGDALYLWGAQLEAGSFPTSYIPTTTAAATRAADVAVMTGTNFSNWYNQSEGTLFAEALTPPNLVAFPFVATISDGSTTNQAGHYLFTSGYYTNVRSGGVLQGDVSRLSAPISGLAYKYAIALARDNAACAANGLVGVPDTSLLMPVGVNQMRIGTNATGGAISNTHIRRIAYWPRRLSNEELQAITS